MESRPEWAQGIQGGVPWDEENRARHALRNILLLVTLEDEVNPQEVLAAVHRLAKQGLGDHP